MLQCHDLTVRCPGSHLQAFRKGFLLRRQRMVPCHRRFLRQTNKQRRFRIELCHGLFAVHQLFCMRNGAAVYFADALMSETHAEDRDFSLKMPHNLFADTGIFRITRSRGQNDVRRCEGTDFFYGHGIISDDFDIRVDTSCHLNKIIRKTIIIID